MRRAEAFEVAPSTRISTNFRAPSPSFTTWWARSRRRSSSASRKPASRRSRVLSTGATFALPVAKRRSVSEVEVSLSTVIALKLPATPFDSIDWRIGAGIGASVATKESIVAMSGAIMPAPLAMPLMVTVPSPKGTVRVASLG